MLCVVYGETGDLGRGDLNLQIVDLEASQHWYQSDSYIPRKTRDPRDVINWDSDIYILVRTSSYNLQSRKYFISFVNNYSYISYIYIYVHICT